MNGLDEILSSPVVHRTGWVLLHSIWQLVLIGSILSLLLTLLRRQSANVRYVIACVGLAAMLLAPIVTYTVLPNGSDSATAEMIGSEVEIGPTSAAYGPALDTEPTPWDFPSSRIVPDSDSVAPLETSDARPVVSVPAIPRPERILSTVSGSIPWLVAAWLLGVVTLCVWNVGGWIAASRLKRLGTTRAPLELTVRTGELAARAGVARPVRLLVSTMAQVPVAIGWLRPVILLPVACVAGMSPQQLDAILAHELAHIQRFDYLVNLLQTAAETLLFYHPAVWWISRRIRTEREHCCDDMAVVVCGSRVEYAEALASLEQQRAGVGHAMAARDDRDSAALARVRRILGVAADDGVSRTRVLGGVLSVFVLVALLAGYVAVAAQTERESDDVRSIAAAALKRIRGDTSDSSNGPDRLHWGVKGTGEELFCLDDIVRFDWDRQVFELTREKAMDFMAWRAPHVGLRGEFQVRDAEGILYEGRVISSASSRTYDEPTIIERNFQISPPLFEIRAGYPGAIGEGGRERFHPRLRAALEEADKLAAIPVDERPNPIATKGTAWGGGRDSVRIRAEIFPDTFRIGRQARAHVFFAPQRRYREQPDRIEIHSTLTTDGGAFFCTTDHSTRDPQALAAAFHKGVTVLRWQPWGPVYGAEQSEAEPGPGEIRFRVVLRDADGNALVDYRPPSLAVTILPRSAETEDVSHWNANGFTIDHTKTLIRGVPVATGYKDIEIFEPTPGVAGEWRIREDVQRFPLGRGTGVNVPFGELYYLPKKNVCYIQWDPVGASTLHYYGPVEGSPDDLLTRVTIDDGNVEGEDSRIDRAESARAASPSRPVTAPDSTGQEKPAPKRARGTVSGVVTDAATGKPVPGAYVAIDRSGDAGGSNLGRFREQGIYVTGETGADGRFTLDDVAFSDKHPLYVTSPGYVRHEQSVAVSKAESEVHVDVRLKPGATIEVTAVDSDKRPLQGETWIRLESKAGPIFVPPREDWPRATMRTEKVRDGQVRFGELPAGEYSIDVMRVAPTRDEQRAMMRGNSRGEIGSPIATTPRVITYHAGNNSVSIRSAENRSLRVSPLGHKSEITIDIAKDPYQVKDQAFVVLVVSRDPGRLLWIGRQFFHPEDHRLGRILRDDLVRAILAPGQSCRLRDLPPGDYAVFVWTMGLYPNFKSPAIFARAAKLEVRDGLTKTVTLPWTDPEGPSFVGPRALMALDTRIQVESRSYSVAQLCSILTATTNSRAKFQAAPSSENHSAAIDAAELSIWELLERLHLHKGWKVTAYDDTFTITSPAQPPEGPRS